MRTEPQPFVPDFQLYGEARQSSLPDLIHVETLKDRSQHYDWEIKPHRHADLCQIMRFRTDNVGIDLDGDEIRTRAPAILFVPPRVVHGFRFSPQVVGTVTTIPIELLRDEAGVSRIHAEPLLIGAGSRPHERLCALLDEIEEEYRRHRAERQRALRALLELGIAWVSRARSETVSGLVKPERHGHSDKRIKDFLELVELNFTRGWSAEDYARRIGTSKSQLTRDCRARMGRSPLQIVHDRVINEANRKLAYTPWPISQISDALGFADLGYFSRFYRKRTGETPSAYRNRIRLRNDPA
ncbi:MAG: helix-turn-helix domain-containing protein [Pseudomonadota bacterium]